MTAPTLFTSESVTEGHPDKLADQISDAILDAILAKDPLARVACEAIITTGLVMVVGEITTDCYVDIPRIIRQTVREVGYTRAKYGFDQPLIVQPIVVSEAGFLQAPHKNKYGKEYAPQPDDKSVYPGVRN